jgi:hypothetical protein
MWLALGMYVCYGYCLGEWSLFRHISISMSEKMTALLSLEVLDRWRGCVVLSEWYVVLSPYIRLTNKWEFLDSHKMGYQFRKNSSVAVHGRSHEYKFGTKVSWNH